MEDSLFAQYVDVIHEHFGIQLTKEKKALLEARTFKMINDNPAVEYSDAAGFLRYLKNDRTGKAIKLLAEAITTHHTYFMREADHFDYFAEKALPFWEAKIKDGDLRTWCAASSSGEEPYTLAMIMADFFSLKGNSWDKTLLATDLSQDILDKARFGVYEKSAVKSLPEKWCRAYFKPFDNEHYQVKDSLKKEVLFRRFNLMTPIFPFKKPFHIIFCRNVMIYFNTATRNELVKKMYDFLEPGGFLFVGHSEVIDRRVAPFDYVMPSVYQRK